VSRAKKKPDGWYPSGLTSWRSRLSSARENVGGIVVGATVRDCDQELLGKEDDPLAEHPRIIFHEREARLKRYALVCCEITTSSTTAASWVDASGHGFRCGRPYLGRSL
jgi:hypothetical protein